jgi:hypothetical protein
MDERILFDQFHEALEMEPRPGAYERMRLAMTNQPVALKRRPVFRMRWSRMGLRVAAILAAAVIALALGAAILATHHGPVGSVPATDPNVANYQSTMQSDYNSMSAATSNHCTTIQDSGCAAAINTVIPTLQKWVSDLNSFKTPSQFAVIDGQLRRHLNEVITEGNAAVAFQKANNRDGFDIAMNAAFYERAWIDPMVFTIEGTYSRVAGSYHDAVNLAKQALDGCVGGTPGPGELSCTRLSAQETCTGSAALGCEADVQTASIRTQTFLIGLTQNQAPNGAPTKAGRAMFDLAQADTALLAITDGLVSGDASKVSAGESAYATAITAADSDLGAA